MDAGFEQSTSPPGHHTPDASESSARSILKEYFGHREFRNGQYEIIRSILQNRHTLVVMPTGGGKSLCYQIPAMMKEGTALVVSPLIALMKDQVDALKRSRIPSTFINSSLHFKEIQQRMTNARFGAYKLLYVAPERLESKQFLEELQSVNISFLAIDEAHCISEWGHDFRPSYLNIAKALVDLPPLPVIALTATATSEVRDDIQRSLRMSDAQTFVRGFDRPNLTYRTQETDRKIDIVQDAIQSTKVGSTIIYCGSRRKVEESTNTLKRLGIDAEAYHAGLHELRRTEIQEQFIEGRTNVLVATSAFGMGVDKADVRNVIHLDLTSTLEAYYQEAGRAGRDGLDSVCTVLYQQKDRSLQEYFLRSTYPELDAIRAVYGFLYDSLGIARGEKPLQALFMDEVSIGNRLNMPASLIGSVLNVLERSELLRRGSQQNKATLQLMAEPQRLREYFTQTTEERREVLEALLRSVGPEALRRSVSVDLNSLVRKHDIPYDQIHKAIRAFEYARLMRYVPAAANGGIALTEVRSALDHIPIDYEALCLRRERALKKLDVVQRYVETSTCKRNFILEYFEDTEFTERCGRCSSCVAPEVIIEKVSERDAFILRNIIETVYELDERFGRVVVAQVLVGHLSPKVTTFALDKSSHFGILKDHSQQELVDRIDVAVRNRFLFLSASVYPTLKVSPSGLEAISKTLPHKLHIQMRQESTAHVEPLLGKLRALRNELASRHHAAVLTVASEAQLTQMALLQPTRAEDFSKINGLSKAFITRFAPDFIRIIQEERASEVRIEKAKTLSSKVMQTVALIRKGHSIHLAAELLSVNGGTVAAHIQEAIEHGVDLPRDNILTSQLYLEVKHALRRNPRAFLKDLRAELGAEYDFAHLRVAAAFVRQEMKQGSVSS